MRIRPEKKYDANAIRKVHYYAFNDHPYTLKEDYKLIDLLREKNALVASLVAEEPPLGIIGHLTISPIQINEEKTNWFYLGPIGVLPEEQRKGVGKQLVKEAIRTMAALGAEGLVSRGDPKFFTQVGFRNDSRLIFSKIQPEHSVLLPLSSNVPEGIITLDPVFSREL